MREYVPIACAGDGTLTKAKNGRAVFGKTYDRHTEDLNRGEPGRKEKG